MLFSLQALQSQTSTPLPDIVIHFVAVHSHDLSPGSSSNSLFFALQGERGNGHHFVVDALSRGATYAIVKKDFSSPPSIPPHQLIRVENPLETLQFLAMTIRTQWPGQVIGIFGSIGKTTLKNYLAKRFSPYIPSYGSPDSYNSQVGVALSLIQLPDLIIPDTTSSEIPSIAFIEAAFTLEGELDRILEMLQPNYVVITSIKPLNLGVINPITHLNEKWMVNELIQSLTSYDKPIKAVISPIQLPSIPYLVQVVPDCSEESLELNCSRLASMLNLILGSPLPEDSALLPSLLQELPQRKIETWRTTDGAIILDLPPVGSLISLRKNLSSLFRYKDQTIHYIFEGLESSSSPNFTRGSLTLDHLLNLLTPYPLASLSLVGSGWEEQLSTSMIRNGLKIHCFSNWSALLCSLQQKLTGGNLFAFQPSSAPKHKEFISCLDPETYPTQLVINLAAIAANIKYFSTHLLSDQTRMMIMLKACGYGTESALLALALEEMGVDYFGVAHLEEAVALRRAGVKADIFVLNSNLAKGRLLYSYNLESAVSSYAEIEALDQLALPIKVHLHVDVGMARFGCRPEESLPLATRILSSKHLRLHGLMTHLPSPLEEPELTQKQLDLFQQIKCSLEKLTHIPYFHVASSNGTLKYGQSHHNLVRIGLAIFGIGHPDLNLALSLRTRIVGINHLLEGECVGYGSLYRARRYRERIAILPVGYYEGIHTQYSSKGFVYLRGCRAPYIGKICMDYMMVDITEIPDAHIGDEVEIFGHHISLEELAQAGSTHVHQLITCLGPRIQRLFIYNESKTSLHQ
jgi:alanine racemase/UDP-N-acetylmuramoyl-tripeptide--D-alanyl-D-alanine ligase